MPSLATKLILFLSSYVPLWVIFAVVSFDSNRKIAIAFIIVSIVSICGTLLYFRLVKSMSTIPIKINRIVRKDSDTMSYIASYIIPFAATTLTDVNQAIALGIFLLVLCVVYISSGMIHVNPLLSFVGYKLYEIELDSDLVSIVLSRKRLKRNDSISVIDIGDDIYVNGGK